jgi:hypothetical protein
MKIKLQQRTLAVILSLFNSVAMVSAQPAAGGAPAIDPNTGLPIFLPVHQWMDPDWKGPVKVLPDVNFDRLPVPEVANYLRQQFSNDFDVVVPAIYTQTNSSGTDDNVIDPGSIQVKLQLKNVTASELFRAMNLEFEIENTPASWELMMNGHRPTAVFRMVPSLLPHVPAPPPIPEPTRMVYFVGDLMGTEKSAGMTMDQIVKSVSEVWRMTYGEPGETIQFHKDAQLLIVKGTIDQIKFVEETLQAMRKKVELEQSRQKAAESRPKSEDPKSGGSSGSGSK